MSNKPFETKESAFQKKPQLEKNAKQIEADKKLAQSKVASVISRKHERNRTQGSD
jgi:hypothetical protein